jgi:hypothetical protein
MIFKIIIELMIEKKIQNSIALKWLGDPKIDP